MKKFFFIIFFLFFFLTKFSYSNDFVYIDINYIINNSTIGQKVISDLDNINKNNLEILKNKQLSLNEKKKNIDSKKNIMSKETLEMEIIKLNNEINDFKNEQNLMSQNFQKLNNQKIDQLINKINPIIQQYMVENKISVILKKESIYVSLNEKNITIDILELVNKNLNE